MPQQKREVELFNRTLKQFIQSTTPEGKDWQTHLDNFLLDYRTTPHTATGQGPATILFNRNIKNNLLSIDKLSKPDHKLTLRDKAYKAKIKAYADSH